MDEYAVAGAEQTPEPALLSSAALAEIAELAGMPGIKVDAAVERLLTDVAEDFVVQVSTFAGALSRHRRAPMVEDRDIELALGTACGDGCASVVSLCMSSLIFPAARLFLFWILSIVSSQ